MLGISEQFVGDAIVVSLEGRVDSTNSDELTKKLREYNKLPVSVSLRAIVLDVSSLSYITSAGFRSLMIAKNEAESVKRSFVLAGVHERLKELLSLMGLFSYFEVHDTANAALSRS